MPNIIEGVKTVKYKAVNMVGDVTKAFICEHDAQRAADVMRGWVVEA